MKKKKNTKIANSNKKRTRLKKIKSKKAYFSSKKSYYAKFPAIEIENEFDEFVDEKFVTIIERIIKGIKFNDNSQFKRWVQKFYIEYKKTPPVNYDEFLKLIIKCYGKVTYTNIPEFEIIYGINIIIYDQLLQNNLHKNYIPYQGFIYLPVGGKCKVKFLSLRREKSRYGTIYYSHHRPKINIGNEEKIVGFSRHSIERIIDRSIYGIDSYIGYSEVTKLLFDNIYFELIEVDGKKLVTFYDDGFAWPDEEECSINVIDELSKYILGNNYNEDESCSYYYRVGYMPLGISEKFATGITLLLPGMRGTPEYKLLQKSKIYKNDAGLIAKNLQNTPKLNQLWQSKSNKEFLKFFHENGVKQIVKLDKEPYNFD